MGSFSKNDPGSCLQSKVKSITRCRFPTCNLAGGSHQTSRTSMSDCLDAGAKASRRKRPRSHFIAALVATNGCFSLALIPGDIHHHHRTRRPHDTRRLISARFQVNIANHGDMENDFTGDSVACTDASRTSDRLNPAKVQAAHNQLGLEACDSRVTAAVTSLAVNRTEEAECTLQQDEDETHLLDGMVDGVIAS